VLSSRIHYTRKPRKVVGEIAVGTRTRGLLTDGGGPRGDAEMFLSALQTPYFNLGYNYK
jgi:hypothetical protein